MLAEIKTTPKMIPTWRKSIFLRGEEDLLGSELVLGVFSDFFRKVFVLGDSDAIFW